MTVKETADLLGVSVSMVYALIEEKRLPCVRIGRRGRRGKIVVRPEDVETFLKSLETAS